MEKTKHLQTEIDKRKPIWNAISEFYLDTELQDSDYEQILKIFLESNLSITQLKAIDLYEVFPVLKGNIITVAGEWNSFDENWLNESSTKAYLKRDNKFYRFKIKIYNMFFQVLRKEHWKEIENRIS